MTDLGPPMKRHLITAISILLFLGFVYIGISNMTKTNHKIKIQDIQLKSKQSDLLQLENKFNLLNKELEKKDLDAKKVKQLEDEKIQLQKQLEDTQSQLQAKANRIQAEKSKIASVVPKLTQTAYAESGNFYKDFIYQHESGNNPNAVNSIGCRGLGQACPGSKLPCGDNYACQDAWFTNYAMTRYGSWEAAYNFWIAHRWW